MGRMRVWLAAGLAALALSAAVDTQGRIDRFIPVGVWYQVPAAADADPVSRDLATIRGLGFNAITTAVEWTAAEPARGRFELADLERVLSLSANSGLRVIVHVSTDALPPWVAGPCTDDPPARADLDAFINEVATRAARSEAFHAIDVSRHVPPGDCAGTRQRFQGWMKPMKRDAAAWNAFAAEWRAGDLKMNVDAAVARGTRPALAHGLLPTVIADGPGHDDWLMARAVDRYGTSLAPKPPEPAVPWSAVRYGAALDGVRSATRDRGWWLARQQAGTAANADKQNAPVTAADLRLWGWSALARGARAVMFDGWRATPAAGRAALTEPDGSPGARARAAGDLAGIVDRNEALFATLRPRQARIAVLHRDRQPPPSPAGDALSSYGVLHALNIHADFIHPAELGAASSRYAAIVAAPGAAPAEPVRQWLEAYARNGGVLLPSLPADRDAAGKVLAAARITPDVRIDGGAGLVEARFLESADAMLLIGMNHADGPQKVTMSFTPDTPEAIWVNLETGTSVSFVQTKNGPVLTHTFGPRDVLVLVRGKRLR